MVPSASRYEKRLSKKENIIAHEKQESATLQDLERKM